ncbi:MAG: ABC transporter permease [Prolixibacteraceae bacterium]|nr:ABC transporter permease [Prolixibacteraceae bacterium]
MLNLIKVIGLALGLTGILFIALFLKNELTYDAYHEKAERIYRFTTTNPSFFNNNHFARIINSEQIPDIAGFFPEIESYVRLAPIMGGTMLYDENYYTVNEAFVCDSTFFNIFDAEMVIGDKQSVLDAPGSMVITESLAKKIFGDNNPVGEIISNPPGQFNGVKTDFTVKGVMKDFPQNSHFHPDLITTPANSKISWWAWTYLLLKEHTSPEKIVSGYADFMAKQNNQPVEEIKTKAFMQKLTDIHLKSDKLREIETNGNLTNIYVLAVAALVLLLISISNYASLNLGMAGFNHKFIAVTSFLGSTKRRSFYHFLIESMIIVAISVFISLLISFTANNIIIKHLNTNLLNGNYGLIVLTVFIFAIMGIAAGLYPMLKQNIGKIFSKDANILIKRKNVVTSNGIIITQYTLAIILIAAVLIISRQTNFVMNNSMGVSDNNVLCMESVHANVQQKFEIFKAELLKHSSIESVSAMLEPPGGEANDLFAFEMEGRQKQNDQQEDRIGVFPCDYSFASLFNLEFLSGNNFSENNSDNEGSGEYIINETAMHYLNFSQPEEILGKSFKLIFSSPGITIPGGKIIGVVKDFYLSSMKKKVGPLVLFKRDKLWLINFVISYKPGMRELAIGDIRKTWMELFPNYPFNFEQVGSMYRRIYKTELLQEKLLAVFTLISLFICSMGLLGISLLVSQQKIKEIGIRKVNGAKVSEILALLNKGFVRWVAIAFVIATPIAWYAMHKWLENFAYKTTLSWWIFALAGLLALGVALLTVSFQSWKAATRNPVEALRYE